MGKGCATTQVANSNKAAAGSITGEIGATVTVTCNEGWSGTEVIACGSDKKWSPLVECIAKNCATMLVANSNKAATNSITGTLTN